MAAISPALAADQTLPTTVENCAYSSFDGILDLGFGGNTSDWMGKINQVTVNDVVYTRVDSFGYFESGTKWCIGNATGAFGSYQALKITYNSSFPATIVISADGYNDLTVEVSKKGSSYTAEIKANSSSGGTEEPKPAETYPITVEQAEHGTVSANYEKAAQGIEVTVTVTPDEDYALETLTVGGVDVTDQVADGEYTFTMPGEAVTVRAALAAKAVPVPGVVTVNDLSLSTDFFDQDWLVTVKDHPGYVAKRMEIGAVVGATPASHVRRECPAPGDVIVLLGGRTGRDGIGGATGSSKAHNLSSLDHCGAEVQKGNAPIERKLQRLFRREDACKMIKRCNDFGAGGVSVAIGELADGLYIDLNKVTKKYDGLDGTELAISESQERMAVALAPEDVDKFIAIATEENLEATPVAKVTEEKRLNMVWNGVSIVNISREFLNSNGAEKHQNVHVEQGTVWQPQWAGITFSQKMKNMVGDLNICSKKGLSERFDSTIGAATVLMPFGGAYQLTPQNAMVAKLPVDGETNTCSGMAWGYNPYLMSANQYIGARMAVVDSVTKLVASGFRYEDAYLTFQEYFERLGTKPERWGKPLAALLGALDAQMGLGIASIGGKDSMSGSFEQLDVPPTLVSFATAIGKASKVVSTEFKKPESTVVLIRPILDPETGCPNFFSLKANYKIVEQMIEEGMVASACAVGYGGIAEALFKMGLGNRIGFKMRADMPTHRMFEPMYGSIVLEMVSDSPAGELLGETTKEYTFESCGETLDMAELQEIWESKLEPVYPYRKAGPTVEKINGKLNAPAAPKIGVAKPKVIIPVFPGTNCEYDTAKAFARAGADPEILVIRNLTPADVTASCEALVKAIDTSQIVMLPGGFSGGDEPDGSAKFIASFFRSPAVTEAVRDLLQHRDGLMLGICNGFQALIKLGLVPYGDIRPITAYDPTLTFNTIGRHQSMLVRTRVASTGSPWLSHCDAGSEYEIAISHGEGRFVAPQNVLDQLVANGQVATQYVDLEGEPTMDQRYNPNGSLLAIEGITSPDGRVFGKMGHSERSGEYLYKNVTGDKYQPIFEGGVDYFKV